MTDDNGASEVPIWPHFVRHVLAVLSDGSTLPRRDLVDQVIDHAALSDSARAETLNTGGYRSEQRISWAISNLLKATLIERPVRASYRITEAGRAWFADHPDGVIDYATARSTFHEYWPTGTRTAHGESATTPVESEGSTDVDPVEQISSGIDRIEAAVSDDLLQRLRDSHPTFFEDAVVKVLLAMGYGGAEQRGKRVGGSGDGGVDGVIDQDALGLERIYVQAKRYAEGNTVGRETIQAFIGALHGFGANRGVFITTSSFTQHARDYAGSIPTRIVLIDGERLVGLMIKYRVGVQVKQTYDVVEVDEDFFE
ncbi:restriction endonuclease [Luteipulveratus halotolerans]|uniref:Restriction endonuclease n=1 Tax=Luteipulveratus halotolerans TaxID=1631356 RepID=A0A0L6CKV7_9MICO|nr:restriction endonuclease [Luteipulveratus halotolerans]KNX38270.1 restriction endonuclease [Luteipulveratus halotolerans]